MIERIVTLLYRFRSTGLDRSNDDLDAAALGCLGDDAALQLLTAWRDEICAQPMPAWATDNQEGAHDQHHHLRTS